MLDVHVTGILAMTGTGCYGVLVLFIFFLTLFFLYCCWQFSTQKFVTGQFKYPRVNLISEKVLFSCDLHFSL